MILLSFSVAPVFAQEQSPPSDTACVTCHENLYFLHDTGKWFCLCEEEMTCTCCHGGNPGALKEDLAHLGMVANPAGLAAATCQKCHAEDTPARLEKFAAVAGVSSLQTALVANTYNPPAGKGPIQARPASPFLLRLLQPWRLVALGALGMAMAGILLFGYHCWKADCLARRQP